ncbi:hypothetical protein BDF22DRAFT_685042 [Syncephalis plumigaleata]|nr:hypothetical protein BDF22DRAFT_685042 [Syncephalis plumigaleata]
MASLLNTIVGLVLVALCWGFTNPFIKRGAEGLDRVRPGRFGKGVSEFLYLATRWQYVVPLLLNLSGSVVYYYTLGTSDLSLVVPITNSMTFLCTTLAGHMLGESTGGSRTWLGMIMVVAGAGLCVSSRA